MLTEWSTWDRAKSGMLNLLVDLPRHSYGNNELRDYGNLSNRIKSNLDELSRTFDQWNIIIGKSMERFEKEVLQAISDRISVTTSIDYTHHVSRNIACLSCRIKLSDGTVTEYVGLSECYVIRLASKWKFYFPTESEIESWTVDQFDGH